MACVRCGGSGTMLAYLHCDGGVCYRCNGSGVDPKETGILKEKKVHKETVIKGKRVVLTTLKDPNGRFIGYKVFIQGAGQGVTCRNMKDANIAFQNLKQQAKVNKK